MFFHVFLSSIRCMLLRVLLLHINQPTRHTSHNTQSSKTQQTTACFFVSLCLLWCFFIHCGCVIGSFHVLWVLASCVMYFGDQNVSPRYLFMVQFEKKGAHLSPFPVTEKMSLYLQRKQMDCFVVVVNVVALFAHILLSKRVLWCCDAVCIFNDS